MSSTKTQTSHESAIAALRPGTGATNRLPDQAPLAASPVSYQIATFRIRDAYDEMELEEAFQTILDRGAEYYKLEDGSGLFEVRIPAEFDPQPYIAALEMATDAIADIELQTELRAMVCGA